MKRKEYLDYLRKRDERTRGDRSKRRSELQAISFAGKLPKLLWEYYTEVGELYITGHFSSVLLWCESILELILADKLINHGKDTKEEVAILGLAKKTLLCHKYKLITQRQKSTISDLRELRNAISHANAGSLYSLSKKYYENIDEAMVACFYLANMGSTLQADALKYLCFTRQLANEWYGQ